MKRRQPGGVEMLERAWELLRGASVRTWAAYYAGSLPFVLALLYFWADMSRSAWAADRAAPASLGLTLLFFWMKGWHHAFGRNLMQRLGRPADERPAGRARRICAAAAVHAAGLFLLALSLITIFPFPWAYAFWQTYTVQPPRPGEGLRASAQRAWKSSGRRPAQNHGLLALLLIFGLAVLANIAAALAVTPMLLKSLLGIQTPFLRTPGAFFNTTFLLLALSLTWLCLDPLVKAVYALRCFRAESRRTGEDIRVDLYRAARPGATAALLLTAVILFAGHPPAAAGQATVSPRELSRSIETVISSPEYSWRLPREKPSPAKGDEPGLLGRFLEWLGDKSRAGLKAIGRWIEGIVEWWDELWPDHDADRPPRASPDPAPGPWPYVALYVLATAATSLLAVFLYRYYRSRKAAAQTARPAGAALTPDLESDSVSADDLPEHEWLVLADSLAGKGDLRLALRALYLSTLARLSEAGLVTLARHKSNQDYRREVDRRARGRDELSALFARNTARVDVGLYGGRPVDRELYLSFRRDQARIRELAGFTAQPVPQTTAGSVHAV